ncbi:MAG: LptF/LptG family permease [Fidelibacterota bacterium]|nr:MAG: LptF/LptG family permease [Candidatus Neomarinimicrobiota bacterium]
MLKLLDRYILSRFLSILMGAMVAFVVIFLVVDVVENLDKFIDAQMPRQAVVNYYLYTIPWFISIALPMATLLATFFSMGLLNKRNEITAMKASGFSIRRIGTSLLLVGLLISVTSFFWDDLLVSEGMRRKSEIQSEYLARDYRRKHQVKKQNIFLQQSPTEHIAIDRFDYREQQAHGVYIQRYQSGRLVQRMDFGSLKWDEQAQQWQGLNYRIRRFSSLTDTMEVTAQGQDTLITLAIKPVDLMKMSVTPEEMRFSELQDFVAQLIRNGIDPTRWEVNMHFKVAFSMTSFIMVLFGLPLSIGRPRSSLAFGAGMSIFVIFGYYVAIKLGQSLGFKGVLDPLPSVWLPNIVFLVLGFILLKRQRS